MCTYSWQHHVDGLMQEIRNSIAKVVELRLTCTNPSMRSGMLFDLQTKLETQVLWSYFINSVTKTSFLEQVWTLTHCSRPFIIWTTLKNRYMSWKDSFIHVKVWDVITYPSYIHVDIIHFRVLYYTMLNRVNANRILLYIGIIRNKLFIVLRLIGCFPVISPYNVDRKHVKSNWTSRKSSILIVVVVAAFLLLTQRRDYSIACTSHHYIAFCD